MTNSTGESARILEVQSANFTGPTSTNARKAEAIRAYNDALQFRDPRVQARARFAALMELAKARGG